MLNNSPVWRTFIVYPYAWINLSSVSKRVTERNVRPQIVCRRLKPSFVISHDYSYSNAIRNQVVNPHRLKG